MNATFFKQKIKNQFLICILVIISVSGICFGISDFIGYRTVALLLLASVSLLSMFFSMYPIFVASALSALIWDFFFIPPHFTFHVDNSEDILMLTMYFVIAILNGVMTSKIRQYEHVEHQKEERQNTIKLYKTLFDSISHELRTPIATIVGATDNLSVRSNAQLSDDNKNKLIDEISIAAFRLNRLIDNLLNMQRLESGLLKPKLDWCEISELIMGVVNRLKQDLESHILTVEVQPDLPLVKLDAGLIDQAIYNIIYNATVYTPPDSQISISAYLDKMELTISISDTGMGFQETELEKVFTKYNYSANPKKGGMGLGLSITKGFIDAHGGHVSVQNQESGGAKFTVVLPVEVYTLNDYLDFSDMTLKNQLHEQQTYSSNH